jgi:hypothetical protein
MRLDDSDGKRFPKFRNYVTFDFGHLAVNDDIVNGLVKWGKMSREQARRYVAPGSGPKIKILDDPNDPGFGKKRWHDFPVSINLFAGMVQAFESKETLSQRDAKEKVFATTGRGQRIYRVGLSMLEQIIQGHIFVFSNDVADVQQVDSTILQFEDDFYGGVQLNI